MITRTSRGTKRIAATAAAVAMVGSALAISGTTALADHVPATTYGGANRYETATLVADALPSVATITVANGLNFPDGLAGAFLEDAILLTEAGSLHPTTKAWLDANNTEVTNIQIVGGEAVISAAVATELATYGTVTRLSGPTRYDTAVAIAEAQSPNATEIIVADGLDFPDALASGPLAIEADAPIILNDGATLRPEVVAYLAANPQVDDAYIVGGNAAVPTTVEAQLTGLGITVERLSGPTRDETAVAIANELQTLTGGYDTGAVIANRLRFPDAMVAGPLAADEDYPILLVSETALPIATEDYLVDNCATIGTIVAVGGEAVINASTSEAARQAATCATVSNQTFAVAGDTATATPGASGTRTCIVTGLTNGTQVDARIFPTEDITNANGTVSFADVGPDSVADENPVNAVIAAVNGAPVPLNPEQNDITVISGAIAVSITGTGVDDVTLAVWQDNPGLTANGLDLVVSSSTSPKVPREAFGVGCRTIFANEATSGAIVASDVTSVSKDADTFGLANGFSYFYDSNDIYQLGASCVQVTQATFETALSIGDSVSGSYNASPEFTSTFCLADNAPANPAGATLTASGTSVKVDIAESATPSVDSYNVYRVVRPTSGTCPNFQTASGRAQYANVGSVADPSPAATPVSFTDTGLSENTFYCYSVTAVDDGSESAGTVAQQVNTGTTADTGSPTITDVRAQDDGLVGVVDTGDDHQFIFSEQMAITVDDDGQVYRIQDADGTIAEITCGAAGNATCALQAAGTYNGIAIAQADRVLRVTITAPVTALPGFLGTTPGVQYPATVTNVSAGWDDIGGNQLNLAGSADKIVDVATITPAP